MDPPKKKRRTDAGGANNGSKDVISVGSVAQLFAGGGTTSEASSGDLSSRFTRLFSLAAASSVGVSAFLAGDSSSSTAAPSGRSSSASGGAPRTGPSQAAEAAAAAARKLLKSQKGKEQAADANGGAAVKGALDAAKAKAPPTASEAAASGKAVAKGKKHPQLTKAERAERDARTLFVGNVPLSWDKQKLRAALRRAVPRERYSGAFKPIWFRSEPLKEEYKNNTMRKVGSMRGAYAKHASDAKNAYVLLESASDVQGVKHEAQGLLADKDHVLRLDGVGEAAQVKFDRKRSVFVGNLPADTTEADLRCVFKSVGDVDAVRIVRDKYASQACKGFAFVRFKERSSVKPALDLWDSEVRGRPIRVMKIEKPEGEQKLTKADEAHPAAFRLQQRHQKRLRNRVRKAAEAAKQAGIQKKKSKGNKGSIGGGGKRKKGNSLKGKRKK